MCKADAYHWINLEAKEYLKLIGPEQYDNVRKITAELHTIRKYIDSHLDKGNVKTFEWSYLDYFFLKIMKPSLNSCCNSKSSDRMDSGSNSMRNIRILLSNDLIYNSSKNPK